MDETVLLEQSLMLLKAEPDTSSSEFIKIRQQLIAVVYDLIQRDFNKLLNILYRIDVDEKKLKFALFESTSPAAETITDLIIERQLQKLKFRENLRKSQSE